MSVHAAADLRGDQVTIVVQHARAEAVMPILAGAYGPLRHRLALDAWAQAQSE